MNFIISASTDVGIKKTTNQDSLTIQTIKTRQGRMVFALICDGMGGLSKGELASATLVDAFQQWVRQELPSLCQTPIADAVIQSQWENIIYQQNQKIGDYGKHHGIRLGTTVVAMLITEQRYYILNVGDSRAYELTDTIRQLTTDQTYVAREVAAGRMTPEQAKTDRYRNVLLQCCGSSEQIYPEMICGATKLNAVYMLCSDGFRHEISAEEIYQSLQPSVLLSHETMQRNTDALIELNKRRMERDNISVTLVRTF